VGIANLLSEVGFSRNEHLSIVAIKRRGIIVLRGSGLHIILGVLHHSQICNYIFKLFAMFLIKFQLGFQASNFHIFLIHTPGAVTVQSLFTFNAATFIFHSNWLHFWLFSVLFYDYFLLRKCIFLRYLAGQLNLTADCPFSIARQFKRVVVGLIGLLESNKDAWTLAHQT